MLNNFIGGGQIFLHKIRMFLQVFGRSIAISCVVSVIITIVLAYPKLELYDLSAAVTYQKALLVSKFDNSIRSIRAIINPKSKKYEHITTINAYNQDGLYKCNINPKVILTSQQFSKNYYHLVSFIKVELLFCLGLMFGIFVLIFLLWTKFGKSVSIEKQISGSTIKYAKEITNYLHKANKASKFIVGDMRLVKDSEIRHIIAIGTTGSGKTNLFNNLIPQIRNFKQPALVVDQTGEMIERYYNPDRGDIIFNPLDARSHAWDFWADTSSDSNNIPNSEQAKYFDPKLDKFAKVLFKFGKKTNSGFDPFWENSAATIFCACVQVLVTEGNKSIIELKKMLSLSSWDKLKNRLTGTLAARYLTASNKTTASSILSVLATSTQPLNLLFESEKKFSLTEYFAEIQQGSSAWLFLSTKPDMRNVTMPIIACLFELAISCLIGIGINEKRRMWFIIDELASLGNLSGFSTLISESRKYGGCILSATQSINQIFDNFGMLQGSTIFGQFATKFLFRSDEPATAKIITEIFGQLEYATSQKNTSFGAHEFRDGVSYTEGTKRKALITTNDLATLADLECFVSLPEPKARIARIKVPIASDVPLKHPGFVAANRATNNNSIINYHLQETSIPHISNKPTSQTDSEQVIPQVPQDQQEEQPWWQEARQEYVAMTKINNNETFKDKQ
ncbi:type IV secretion system DNA-binding domain-containing protein [Candidatus Tisiphia endosymbiont of Ceraclea dissimilis]|uniref:type IV secretion system DNA-binding domain-containing protein n=1 Tax=Candidatus Tisiphia endosymbiont of Ceraclea dissimilis TaxID=3077928 RepID=UPI003CCB0348